MCNVYRLAFRSFVKILLKLDIVNKTVGIVEKSLILAKLIENFLICLK